MTDIEFTRAKSMHALSDAEYEALQMEEAALLHGTKPWLVPGLASLAINAKVYDDFGAILEDAPCVKPTRWQRFVKWLKG